MLCYFKNLGNAWEKESFPSGMRLFYFHHLSVNRTEYENAKIVPQRWVNFILATCKNFKWD